MGEEGKYAELLGKESDTNAGVRSSAFHEVIDQYPDLEMVAQQTANWEKTEAFDKTEAILQANPELDGIICGNDTMLEGAVAACEAAGKNIPVIGVDGSDEAAALIKDGKMCIRDRIWKCKVFGQDGQEIQVLCFKTHENETKISEI